MVVIFIFVQNLVMISIAQNVWQHNRFVDNVKGEPSEKQMLDIYIINLCCILIKKEKFNQKILEKLMFASIVWLIYYLDLQNLKNITFHLENETHFILKL
jgi:hypothetical protein